VGEAVAVMVAGRKRASAPILTRADNVRGGITSEGAMPGPIGRRWEGKPSLMNRTTIHL